MKKNVSALFALVLVCVLVLGGCACSHEWQEADCLTARTCTKCEAVEGEALGHNWQEATCTVPETCTRCGETRGEVLAHTYSQWIMGETHRSRSCESCGKEETAEIDREQALYQALAGHWDFLYQQDGKKIISLDIEAGYQYAGDKYVGQWLSCTEDGSVRFFDNQNILEGTAAFLAYFPEDGHYEFDLILGEETRIRSCLIPGDTSVVELYPSETNRIQLFRHPILEEEMTDLWLGADSSQIFSIDLKRDRTFTADLEEEISGIWHMRPSYETLGSRFTHVILCYEQKGKTVTTVLYPELGTQKFDLGIREGSSKFTVLLNGRSVYFYQKNSPELNGLEDAIQSATTAPVGQWNSLSITDYSKSAGKRTTIHTDDTIVFNEDGTVTAELDTEYKGTWKYSSLNIGSGGMFGYSYTLDLEGVTGQISCWIHENIYTGDKELSIEIQNRSKSSTIVFSQESKSQLDAKIEKAETFIAGDWNSDGTDPATEDYTASFLPDGTFTLQLEKEITGTWTLEEVKIDSMNTHYYYDLKLDQPGFRSGSYVYIHNNSSFYICLKQGSAERRISFTQVNKEEREQILGTWTCSGLIVQNEQTNRMESVEQKQYTLTINADGTYTSDLEKLSDGTWSFCMAEQAAMHYTFTPSDGNNIATYPLREEVLCVWGDKNGEYYYFRKVQ